MGKLSTEGFTNWKIPLARALAFTSVWEWKRERGNREKERETERERERDRQERKGKWEKERYHTQKEKEKYKRLQNKAIEKGIEGIKRNKSQRNTKRGS